MSLARTRVTIIEIGLLFAVAAFGFFQGRDAEVYWPWLWPAWLAVAAIACVVFALRIQSAFWWQLSRILVVIGAGSRCVSILFRALDGTLVNAWSGLGGATIYLICAHTLHRLWGVDFRYWSRRVTATSR